MITYGALVQKALLAAAQVERQNPDWSVEMIDLRSLAPYDWEAIARVGARRPAACWWRTKTASRWGYGAEIAARIADELFDYLDAPVRRVGALDTWVGYHPQLEDGHPAAGGGPGGGNGAGARVLNPRRQKAI